MESSKFLKGVSIASEFISSKLSGRRRKALMESLLAVDDNFEKYKRKLTPNNQLRREKKPMRRTINYRRLNKASRKNKRATEQFDSYFIRVTHPIVNKEEI